MNDFEQAILDRFRDYRLVADEVYQSEFGTPIGSLSSALSSETAARIAGDSSLQSQIDNINANGYVLPTASSSTKGGVKIGSGLTMNGETLNLSLPSEVMRYKGNYNPDWEYPPFNNGEIYKSVSGDLLLQWESTFVTLASANPTFTPTSFTLAANSWTNDTTETSDYTYYANISATGVTANDYAEINFSRGSLSIIEDAELCPSGETAANVIKLYAKSAPTSTISGQYVIFKGEN